jgi:hypothetical protein
MNKVLQGFLSIIWNTAMFFPHPRTYSLNLAVSKHFSMDMWLLTFESFS